MNAPALLALVGDLYGQLLAAQDRIAELEAQLQARSGANGYAAPPRETSARTHAPLAHEDPR